MDILFVTSNEYKVKMFESILDRELQHIKLDVPEIQAIDVQEVIEQKARAAFLEVGKPVLVEDTSLAFHAWNGLPGALIRWFLETVGNDGICQMLAVFEGRTATAETCLGYFDGEKFASFSGMLNGRISKTPRGTNGFGWDPIFIPEGWEKTLAEMNAEEQSELFSMRKDSILELKNFLDEHAAT